MSADFEYLLMRVDALPTAAVVRLCRDFRPPPWTSLRIVQRRRSNLARNRDTTMVVADLNPQRFTLIADD